MVGPFLGERARIVSLLILMEGRLPVKTSVDSEVFAAAPKSCGVYVGFTPLTESRMHCASSILRRRREKKEKK